MPRVYSEQEKKIIYDYYVLQSKLSIGDISKKLVSHNIIIKSTSLGWLVDSWGWVLYRNLAKYQNITYSFIERNFADRLPSSILDKVSRDNIKKINGEKRKLQQNRKYRDKIKKGEMVAKVEVVDITTGSNKEFKVVSEVVKIDHKTQDKTQHTPTVLGQLVGQHSAFSTEEEMGYEALKKQMFSYSKLNHSIERLMGDIVTHKIDESNQVTLLEKFCEVFDRLANEGLLVKRQELINMRQQDLSNESIEQARVQKSLAYNYVNQGLRDEYQYNNGLVRKVEFKDKDGEDAEGVVSYDEQYEMRDGKGKMVGSGTKIKSKPARLTNKHLNVMGTMQRHVHATQINNVIATQNIPSRKPDEETQNYSVEELEKKINDTQALTEIIKNVESKLQTTKLDDCDNDCSKCHIKMSCTESTLINGIGNINE